MSTAIPGRDYEITRVPDEADFHRKMRIKRFLYRFVGELYIGKRSKLRYFRRHLRTLPLHPGATILEVGSGDGLFTLYAAKAVRHVRFTGLELNEIEARVCQAIATREGLNNLTFVPGLLGDKGWSANFDAIFCLDVLEHVREDVAAMREMYDALKPGGTLLTHVPSRTFVDTDGSIKVVSDEEAWRVNPGHVRNGYTAGELHDKLLSAGFRNVRCKRVSGWHIARAHQIHVRNQSPLRRLLILPLLDFHHWRDARSEQPNGNTIWCWAERPVRT